MKLRNKKTGEIKELKDIMSDMIDNHIVPTLITIENEWEDYEEPKEYWYIDWTPEIGAYHTRDTGSDADDRQKEIGNYFETKEEAEKAVEKLKAWKRLKDNGFKVKDWKFTPDMKNIQGNYVKIESEIPQILINKKDIDLLFGGEE